MAVEAVKLDCCCFLPRLWPSLIVGAHKNLAKVTLQELALHLTKVALQELVLHCGMGLSLHCKFLIAGPAVGFPHIEGVQPLESTVHLCAAQSHVMVVARKESRGREICCITRRYHCTLVTDGS